MINTNTTTIARYPNTGDHIHHQDQLITLYSFSTKKITNTLTTQPVKILPTRFDIMSA